MNRPKFAAGPQALSTITTTYTKVGSIKKPEQNFELSLMSLWQGFCPSSAVCAANGLGMRRPSKGRHANMFFTRTDTECPVWVGNLKVFESQVCKYARQLS